MGNIIHRDFSNETKFVDTDTETFFSETKFSDTDTETTKKLAKVSRPGSLETETSHSVSHAVRMSHAVRTLEPNQPKDNVKPIHTLWDNCCTQFEDTQFECGLLSLLYAFHQLEAHAILDACQVARCEVKSANDVLTEPV